MKQTNQQLISTILNRTHERDRQILELRASGMKTKDIASKLGIKHSTCRASLARLLKLHR